MDNLVFNKKTSKNKERSGKFSTGIKKGIPIALGYIPVSFTFGLMMANSGMPAWIIVLISMTNLTSAGQFAGAGLIVANASLFEITLTTFVINIRYLLMSLSLSQKLYSGIPLLKRCIMAFGVTDEIFTVASLEQGNITFAYMAGLILLPYLGWAAGTAIGAVTTAILPPVLQSSMGIALYGMFIALVIPASKKSRAALVVVITAVALSSFIYWFPYMKMISGGWGIITATIVSAALGAVLFPREGEEV